MFFLTKIYFLVLSCLVIISVPKLTFAQVEIKTKVIDSSYLESNINYLDIDNTSGKIEIHSWDRSYIEVKVEATGRAYNESNAQSIIDSIKVSIVKKVDTLKYLTIIKRPQNNINSVDTGGGNLCYEAMVDYEVYIPSNLRAINLFTSEGNVYIDDFGGDLRLEIHHGDFLHGILSGMNNIIKLFN